MKTTIETEQPENHEQPLNHQQPVTHDIISETDNIETTPLSYLNSDIKESLEKSNTKSDSPLTTTLKSVDLESSIISEDQRNAFDISNTFISNNSADGYLKSNITLQNNLYEKRSVIENLDLHISQVDLQDINELIDRLEIFKNCFDCLLTIKENEKIWIEDDEITIDQSPYYSFYLFQSVNRYMNNQGRENLFIFIDVKFTEYMRYLDNIQEKISYYSDNKLFKKVIQDNIKFIHDLITGLHTVKITYSNYLKLCNKITSIILTFIDFKDLIQQKLNIK